MQDDEASFFFGRQLKERVDTEKSEIGAEKARHGKCRELFQNKKGREQEKSETNFRGEKTHAERFKQVGTDFNAVFKSQIPLPVNEEVNGKIHADSDEGGSENKSNDVNFPEY